KFAARYGASPEDLKMVAKFVKGRGLKVVETHAARRSVVASGTVAQMSKAFAVPLGRYQHQVILRRGAKPQKQTYRGRDGFIHIPKDLQGIIIGVFGLDNRSITKLNGADPPNTGTVTVPQMAQLYNFPANSALGQTIAIWCGLTENGDGYNMADIQKYFAGLPPGHPQPAITNVS